MADKVIKTKVGLLELGKRLGNVSKACRNTPGIAVPSKISTSMSFMTQVSSLPCMLLM